MSVDVIPLTGYSCSTHSILWAFKRPKASCLLRAAHHKCWMCVFHSLPPVDGAQWQKCKAHLINLSFHLSSSLSPNFLSSMEPDDCWEQSSGSMYVLHVWHPPWGCLPGTDVANNCIKLTKQFEIYPVENHLPSHHCLHRNFSSFARSLTIISTSMVEDGTMQKRWWLIWVLPSYIDDEHMGLIRWTVGMG